MRRPAPPIRSTPAGRCPAALALVLAAPLFLAAVACAEGPTDPRDPVPAELRAPDLDTGDWTRVERPGFAFRLPPGFERVDLQPIDSDAAVFEKGESSTLSYDHGIYGAPTRIPEGAGEVHRDVRTTIGGRTAVLLSYRHAGTWVVAARWSGLGASLGSEVALLLTGRTPHAGVRDEILAAIHSVRFP